MAENSNIELADCRYCGPGFSIFLDVGNNSVNCVCCGCSGPTVDSAFYAGQVEPRECERLARDLWNCKGPIQMQEIVKGVQDGKYGVEQLVSPEGQHA